MAVNKTPSKAESHFGVTLKEAIQNYRNARRFLGECNSVAILRQYRGAALNQCRNARNALLDEMLRVEMGR